MHPAFEIMKCRFTENAGQEGLVIIANVHGIQDYNQNLPIRCNIMSEKQVGIIAAGIPDPARVIQSAVETRLPYAGMILTVDTPLRINSHLSFKSWGLIQQ